MKHFYFLFILLLGISSTFAQQHHISEVGIPVDGLVKEQTIVENTAFVGDDQNAQEQQTTTISKGSISFEDVDFVGASKGEFSVSLSGQATYNFPIEVPVGINGIMPNIGIAYSSNGGNGLAGYGWDISGLSAIAKTGSNKYLDGKASTITYGDDDQFMLDGQRLIIKSGAYGVVGQDVIYETENYSNLKIYGVGETYNHNHDYFKVEYPDGSVAYYGQAYGGLSPSVTKNNNTYALTYITNPQNIIIKFTYINDNGNLLISGISYGYRSSNPLSEVILRNSNNYISFLYKDRARSENGYIHTDATKLTKILDKITVRGFTEMFKTYQLTYKTTSLGYEQLQKITETSGDGTQTKVPVTFSYGSDAATNLLTEQPSVDVTGSGISLSQLTAYNTQTIPGDFSGSGKLGYLMYHTTYNDNHQYTKGDVLRIFDPATNDLYSRTFLTPFNEVVATKTLDYQNILLPNQGFTTITKTSTDFVTGKINFKFESFIFMPDYVGQMALMSTKNFNLRNFGPTRDNFISADFNGDGISEIIRTEHPKNYADNTYNQYSTNLEIIDLKNNQIYNNQTLPIGFNYQVADTDGDGYDEFIVYRHGAILIHKFNQDLKKLELSKSVYSSTIAYTSNDKRPVYSGDFNGDGKMDFVVPNGVNSSSWTFFIQTGTYFNTIVKDLGVVYNRTTEIPAGGLNDYFNVNEYTYIFTDVNNDGKTDIVKTHDFCKVMNGTSSDFANTTQMWVCENLKFGEASADINFSINHYPIGTSNRRSPIYTVSNYNDKNYKTDLAVITNKSLRSFKYNRDNVLTQQLKSINELDITTNIVYDTYDEKKTHIPTYAEDAVLPFVSFSEPMAIYPKVDIDVAPGFYLVKKVIYKADPYSFGGNSTDRKQLFTYADATLNHNGKGFLGFKGVMHTNVYKDISNQIKNVKTFDLDNNGLIKLETTAKGDQWGNFFTVWPNFINKKTYSYNITNLSNKVLKAQNNKIDIEEQLAGIQRTITSTYDNFLNPLSISEIVTAPGSTSTLNKTNTYLNDETSGNYHIGRLSSQIKKMNNEQTSQDVFTYTGNLVTTINKKGASNSNTITESKEYDVFGNVTKETLSANDIQPLVKNYTYDTSGRFIESQINVDGLTTSYVYNKNKGWLLQKTNTHGLTESYGYSPFGMVISQADYLGKVTNFVYKSGSPNVLSSSFVRKETTYPDGIKNKETTNAWGVKTFESITDIEGNWINTSYTYDSQNRLIKKSEPYKSSATMFTTIEYDEYGRTSKTVLPTGKEITAHYNGLVTTITDGGKTKVETKNTNNQVKKVVDNGETINYNYNPNGTLQSTGYGANIISFEYDGWGRKNKMTDPSAGTFTYEHNSVGNLLKETAPNGITTNTFDATGKIVTTTHSGNTISYSYNNDKLLNQITTTNAWGTYQENMTYDNYKRVVAKTFITPYGFNYIYNFTFDEFGRALTEEKKVTGSSGTDLFKTKNIFKNGYLWKLQNASTNTDLKVYNTFNERGQLTNSLFANGLSTNKTYDQYGYLTENLVKQGNTELFKMNNAWDVQRGNLTSRNNTLFTGGINETFQYDSFDRLTNFHTSWGSVTVTQEDISYDGKGRITQAKPGTYNYDAVKQYQLSTVTDINILGYYQANPLQQVTYNERKAPLTIKQQGKENIFFNYNGFDKRTAMFYGNEAADYTASSNIRYYSPVGDIEVDFDKTTNKYIVNMFVDGDAYSANILQRKENNNNALCYLHRDYLGSILAITNSAGAIVEKRHFDAWGNVLLVQNGQNSSLNKLTFLDRGYTGHEHLQGVDLINMNARLYDAKLHRFLAPDNYVQDPANSQNYNRYGYALNNPLKFTDPSGEIFELIFGIGNLVAHKQRGESMSFWKGLGYFAQGFVAGAVTGPSKVMDFQKDIFGVIGFFKGFGGNWDYFKNVGKIYVGRFYLDENKTFVGGMIEGISRFTAQDLQTEVGYTYTHLRNIFGSVDRVDYLGGATFATDENNVNGNDGVTMGSFINIRLEGEITGDNFDTFVTQSPLYMHEYGHYIDGQRMAGVYFQAIGIPSAMSNVDFFNKLFGIGDSDFYYTEKRANRRASDYFDHNYHVDWSRFNQNEWPR